MKTMFVIFSVIIIGILLTGCGAIRVNDYVVAKTDIDLKNYDDETTSLAYKPITCKATKGEVFIVTSHNNEAGLDLLGLYDQDNGCWGGGESQNFKLVK